MVLSADRMVTAFSGDSVRAAVRSASVDKRPRFRILRDELLCGFFELDFILGRMMGRDRLWRM